MVKVIIIAGPTASGKTAFSQQVAKERGGVILNGDSLQVYGGLEILTAQPSPEEQQAIPHRLYGFLDPSKACSVGLWLSYVCSEIAAVIEEGKVPIVVGGTGLYLKALMEGLPKIPPIASSVREMVQDKGGTQESLYNKLQEVDPLLAVRIHPQDRQRILRALEVFYGTGEPLSFWQSQKSSLLPYAFEKILLMPSKEILKEKVGTRLDYMLEKGVLGEVAAFLKKPSCTNAQKAIGVKEFASHLKGENSLEWAKEQTLLHTLQYVKRQRTWFAHQFQADALLTD